VTVMTLYYLINQMGVSRSQTEHHRPIYNLYYLLRSDFPGIKLIEIKDFLELSRSKQLNPQRDAIITNDNFVRILDELVRFTGKKVMLLLNSTRSSSFNGNILSRYKSINHYYSLINRHFATVFLSRTQHHLYQQWLGLQFARYAVLPNYTVGSEVASEMYTGLSRSGGEILADERERRFYREIWPRIAKSGRRLLIFYKMTGFTRELIAKLGSDYYAVVLDHLFRDYLDDGKLFFHGNFRNLDVVKRGYLFIHTSDTEGMPSIVKNCLEASLPILIPKWDGLAQEILHPYPAGLTFERFSVEEVLKRVEQIGAFHSRYRVNAQKQFQWLLSNQASVAAHFRNLLVDPSSQVVAPHFVTRSTGSRTVYGSSVVVFVTCGSYFSRANEYNRPRYNLPLLLMFYGLPVVYLEYRQISRYLGQNGHLLNLLVIDMFGGYRRYLNDKLSVYKRLTVDFPQVRIKVIYIVIFSEPDLLKRIVSKAEPFLSCYYLHPKQHLYMGNFPAPSLEMYCPNATIKQHLQEMAPQPRDDLPVHLERRKIVVFYKPNEITSQLTGELLRTNADLAFLYLTRLEDSEGNSHPSIHRCRLNDMSYLERCFLFIHTSQEEGFPTIIKDCLEHRLPMIVPSYGGLSELLFHPSAPGIIYRSTAEIAQSVLDLLADPVRHQSLRSNALRVFERLRAQEVKVFYQLSRELLDRTGLELETRHRFVFYLIGRNVESYLTDCFRSILRQRGRRWRVLYFDDQSTDRSQQRLQQIVDQFSLSDRVTVIRNSKRMYSSYNLKQLSDSYFDPKEILIQLDPDDFLVEDPFILHKIDSLYSAGKTWMTYGQYFSWEREGLVLRGERPNRPDQYHQLKRNQFEEGKFPVNFQVFRSYYAFLLKRVSVGIFQSNGRYNQFNNDVALMKALFQLCPHHLITINPEPYYVYRVEASVRHPESFRNRKQHPELDAQRQREMLAILKYPAHEEMPCEHPVVPESRRISGPQILPIVKSGFAPPPRSSGDSKPVARPVRPRPKSASRSVRSKAVEAKHPRSSSVPARRERRRPLLVQAPKTSYLQTGRLKTVPAISRWLPDRAVGRRSMMNQINLLNQSYAGNQLFPL
jgi:glycosyltransferase involved in cell wall biosynthesis